MEGESSEMRRVCFQFLTLLVFASIVFGSGAPRHGRELAAKVQEPLPAEAEIKFLEMRPARPPLTYLYFDVLLRNEAESPRWFLLPSNVGPGRASIGGGGGIDALEVYAPQGKGRVILCRFLGTGGFQALLMPPRAEIRLRRFPISHWGDPPKSLEIEVVIVERLTIGDETAESWVGPKLTSSVNADISEDAGNAKRIIKSKHTQNNKEVTPSFQSERKLQLQVLLEK